MQNNERIAIFHCNWVVQSQTANALIMLADAGYDVELFVFNRPRPQDYVDFEELSKRTNAQVHQLWTANQALANPTMTLPADKRRFRSLMRTGYPALAYTRSLLRHVYDLYSLRRGLAEGLLAPGLVDRALKLMAGKQYRCLIGVEKQGLIWAGLIAQKAGIPFFYYSLELYIDDDHYWRVLTGDRLAFKRLRLGERLHHRNAAGTIIQDTDRARVLFRHNRLDISSANVFCVPVSVLGGRHKQPSRYLQESLGIPRDRKIILYFGHIWERRYVLELVEAAQSLSDDWVLVMHGEASGDILDKIRKLDRGQKVMLSLKMVPSEEVQVVIASADVGLLFYSGQTENERLTAFASEKMALYMQCGVPFIAFDYPGFRRLANDDRCGVVIGRLEELTGAIHEILMSYAKFREAAYLAFDKHYNYASNFAKVVEAIGLLQTSTIGVKGNSRQSFNRQPKD